MVDLGNQEQVADQTPSFKTNKLQQNLLERKLDQHLKHINLTRIPPSSQKNNAPTYGHSSNTEPPQKAHQTERHKSTVMELLPPWKQASVCRYLVRNI
jgi:hypothetical protein